MTRLRVFLSRLIATMTGRRREDELRDEIQDHLDRLADEHRQRGLSDAEARLAARRAFGGVDATRESFGGQRRLPSLDALVQDLRFAMRALRRERATTLAAIALLTVGVSGTVVLADVLDRLLLRPPSHVDDPARVRRLYGSSSQADPSLLISNYITFERLAAGIRGEVEAVSTYMPERIGSGHGTDATRFEAIDVGEAYFDVLGITPQLGTLPSSRRPSDPSAVVISHALWQQRFGGAADVIGRSLRLGQRTHTVVAVTPRGFAGIDDDPVDVWVPLESRITIQDWRTSTGYYGPRAIARLRPGVAREAAEAHASQVYNAVHQEIGNRGVRPVYRLVFGPLPPAQAPGRSLQTQTLLAVAAVSVLVLLMACGNVGNLLVLAGLRRSSELALKAALGATRGRLLREVLLQGLLLAAAAGAVALGLVLTLGVLVRQLLLPPIAATVVPLDGRLAAMTVLVCAGVALVLAIAPAIRLTRERTLMPGRLRPGAPSRLLDTFVALQVALSVPLLVGTLLFAISFWNAVHVDLGFRASRVAVVKANLADDGRPKDQHETHRRIQARLRELPGVADIALAQSTPLQGGLATVFEVPGYTFPAGGFSMPMVNAVDPAFLSVMGMRVVEGRGFTEADNRPKSRVTVINDTMARMFWAGQSPIGRCIQIASKDCTQVIGVVAKAPAFADLNGPLSDMAAQYFVPIEAFPDMNRDRVLLVRTVGAPDGMLARLRTEAQAAGADLPYVDVSRLDEVFERQLKPLRLGSTIFIALSALALLIAVAGLVVVTAHGVTRRTREMGIRLVLGAKPGDLVRLMARRTIAALTIGLVSGAALSYWGARLLKTVLIGIEPGDPRVFVVAAIGLFVVGGLATYVPARRTGRIDPSAALRIE